MQWDDLYRLQIIFLQEIFDFYIPLLFQVFF